MTNKLPNKIKEKILLMPEYRQGVNKVKVRLKNGSEFSDVYIAWGSEIVRVGTSAKVPFNLEDVEDVVNDI